MTLSELFLNEQFSRAWGYDNFVQAVGWCRLFSDFLFWHFALRSSINGVRMLFFQLDKFSFQFGRIIDFGMRLILEFTKNLAPQKSRKRAPKKHDQYDR